MIGALAEPAPRCEEPRYLDAARRLRGVPAERAARRARPAAAHLQRRSRQDRRLSRGPRLPAGGADRAVRSDLRGALVRAGERARRRADRPLRRPRARRLLLDRLRRRSADRAAQGPRGHPDPRPAPPARRSGCCGWPSSRASTSYERHAVSVLRLLARDRPPPPERVRTPAAGAALAALPRTPDRLRGARRR